MKTGPAGIALMHHYEQCRLTAYPDPGTGGAPWTIGWGDTGPDVVEGLTITQAEADARFARRLAEEFEPGVLAAIRGYADPMEFDAMVCLAYNIGVGSFGASTVLRKHNAGDKPGAADAFRMWNKSGGRVMKGLQRRREAERAVYIGREASDAIDFALKAYP